MINLFNIKKFIFLFFYLFLYYISKYNPIVKHFIFKKLLQEILFFIILNNY